ncbi:MAG: hypothetical protein ACP5VE_00075 [Chthonomonadales bacterium]
MKVLRLLPLLALLPTRSMADDGQAFLGIFAATESMKMAGMPAIPKIQLPPGVQLPPQAAAALEKFTKAHRSLVVRLWSPGIAPDGATATLGIPDGLKLGNTLVLDLYRPKPSKGAADADTGSGEAGIENPDMVIKQYWGSSPTVKPGQPETIEMKGLADEQKAYMRRGMAAARGRMSYFYKPNWTTGYWPTERQPGRIADDAVLTGHYALTTSYTGNVDIDVPANVSFLPAIELSSPNLEHKINFDEPIVIHWQPIPNILGLHAQIIGMQGRKTIILWDSAETKPPLGFGFQDDFMQMAEVKELVSRSLFMAPDRVEAIVPAGIFKDCDFVMLRMVGYGPGAALEKGQPLPRVQTKTVLTVMLGGKQMPGGAPGEGRGGIGIGPGNILQQGD